MSKPPVALVAGVGPGLGVALVEKFASEGFRVAAVARDHKKLEALLGERGLAAKERAYSCDVSDTHAVQKLFASVESDLGTPSLVAFNAGAFTIGSITDLDPDEVARCWRIGCFGGFLVGQAAARGMLAAGIGGTILFTGATAGLRGSARFAPFAMSKFGLRALAQSMARELGPKGIHVAHVIIDGGIGEAVGAMSTEVDAPDKTLSPDAIAESYWQVHRQLMALRPSNRRLVTDARFRPATAGGIPKIMSPFAGRALRGRHRRADLETRSTEFRRVHVVNTRNRARQKRGAAAIGLCREHATITGIRTDVTSRASRGDAEELTVRGVEAANHREELAVHLANRGTERNLRRITTTRTLPGGRHFLASL